MNSNELKDLAGWLLDVTRSPYWRQLNELIEKRIKEKTDAIMRSPDEQPYERGFVCGMKEVINKPNQLIKDHLVTASDTEKR